jgi:hypothetical protein
MNEQKLQNPADKYPKPPYPKQSQPWPGLASKMNPRPDHGETSYRGSMAPAKADPNEVGVIRGAARQMLESILPDK